MAVVWDCCLEDLDWSVLEFIRCLRQFHMVYLLMGGGFLDDRWWNFVIMVPCMDLCNCHSMDHCKDP